MSVGDDQGAPGAAQAQALDPKAFRAALGHFVTGIAVITADGGEGEPIGLTVSSFNSVSLSPPLILFSIHRDAYSLDALWNAGGFAVNVLGRRQERLSNRFARAGTDKWRAVRHTRGLHGAPLLEGASAYFECRPWGRYDGGDHEILVGEVLRFGFETEDDPLVFFRGRYGQLQHGDERMPDWPQPWHYL